MKKKWNSSQNNSMTLYDKLRTPLNHEKMIKQRDTNMFTILSFFLCSQIQNMSQSASKKVRTWFKIKVKLALALQSNCAPLFPFYTFLVQGLFGQCPTTPPILHRPWAFRNDDAFLTFQFHQYLFSYSFATNNHPPSIHFQFILSALGLFLAVN